MHVKCTLLYFLKTFVKLNIQNMGKIMFILMPDKIFVDVFKLLLQSYTNHVKNVSLLLRKNE